MPNGQSGSEKDVSGFSASFTNYYLPLIKRSISGGQWAGINTERVLTAKEGFGRLSLTNAVGLCPGLGRRA